MAYAIETIAVLIFSRAVLWLSFIRALGCQYSVSVRASDSGPALFLVLLSLGGFMVEDSHGLYGLEHQHLIGRY